MAVSAAVDGLGVCLESLLLVERELQSGRLIAPLGLQGIKVSGYTFNALKSRAMLPKIRWFQEWLFGELETSSAGNYLTTGHNASA
jgi:LysR family glycine cleavage system transcriptional activator